MRYASANLRNSDKPLIISICLCGQWWLETVQLSILLRK